MRAETPRGPCERACGCKVTTENLRHGKQVVVDHPDLGSLAFAVAPGSADGTCLHFRGRGRGAPAGDLHVLLECLDPVPAIIAEAAEPQPTGKRWLWLVLALVIVLIGPGVFALGVLMLAS